MSELSPEKPQQNTSIIPAHLQPPQALDVEATVLGALMIEQTAIDSATALIDRDVFYRPAHRTIYDAIIKLYSSREPVDFSTVYQELKKRNKAEEAGGIEYLSHLTNNVFTAANIEYHIKILLEKKILRDLITISGDIATKSFKADEDAFDIVEYAEKRIFDLAQLHVKKTFMGMKEAITDTLEYIEAIQSKSYENFAVPTGFYALNDILGGFQKSDLIILAARPSMGKTALALNLARNAAVMHNLPVGVFSLEMSFQQLVMRLICAEAKVNAQQVRTGRVPQEDNARLVKVASKLANAPLIMDDTSALSISELRSKARRLKSEFDIRMIIIDYLQLMRGPKGMESREREISEISRTLKAIAKELNIPVIALSQLNRKNEERTDKRPMLSDLRESGSIEQDADVVMFIHRPEYYGKEKFEDGNSTKGIAEIIVAKQRNGPVGEVKLKFQNDIARFENLEMVRRIDEPQSNRNEEPDFV